MSLFAPLIRWRYRVAGEFRRRRFAFFWNTLGQYAGTRWWLDLGGGPGSYLLTHLEALGNGAPRVLLLDTDEAELRVAQQRFPNIQCIRANGEQLPFCENAFDLVFCSSVIEHVAHPAVLAAEIRRTGRRFFVQTPNEHFPLESHSPVPLPFFRQLPRTLQWYMCRLAGASWDYIMSVRYVTEEELRAWFPRARVLREHAWGLTKSFYVLAEDT
jgi:ubiquinone/menaquinone biosynthesis C-methylase UbiE